MNPENLQKSIYLSEGIQQCSGWGETEYDEFKVPFQWIGKQASIKIQVSPTIAKLYIYAGSPDFKDKRNLTVSISGQIQTRQISPGWHAYQFDLAGRDDVVEATICVDRMLDIQNDSRDLGIMVREMRCLSHEVTEIEWKGLHRNKNARRRIDYYNSEDGPDILWLASFPRSGNTWMRFLLTNLLFEPVRQSDTIAKYIDAIDDPLYGLRDPGERDIQVFGARRAHIIKTHSPFSLTMPLKEKTVGAIYVLRNPLDVAVSIRKFQSWRGDLIEEFLTYGIDPDFHSMEYVNWHNHVFSWLTGAKIYHEIPVLLIKYEELIEDVHSTCKRILRWLQIERSDKDIINAVERSSIHNMRNMETREVEGELPGIFFTLEHKRQIQSGWRFLADGKSDNYRAYLSREETQLGMTTFGAAMKRLGYL